MFQTIELIYVVSAITINPYKSNRLDSNSTCQIASCLSATRLSCPGLNLEARSWGRSYRTPGQLSTCRLWMLRTQLWILQLSTVLIWWSFGTSFLRQLCILQMSARLHIPTHLSAWSALVPFSRCFLFGFTFQLSPGSICRHCEKSCSCSSCLGRGV